MRLLLAIGLAGLAYSYVTHHDNVWSLTGGPMDGTVWEVRVKPDSWFSLSQKDTLIFDSGHLVDIRFMSSGFPSGSYSAAGRSGDYSWQASFQNSKSEILEWSGHVRDDRIEGEIVRRDAGGRGRRLRFKGNRKLS